MDPYYQDESVTLYHGDCLDVMGSVDFDSVVTDPPYGINFRPRDHARDAQESVEWDDRVPYELLPMFGRCPVIWFGSPIKVSEAFGPEGFAEPPTRMLMWAPKFTLSMSANNGIAYRWHPIYTWRLPTQSPAVHDVLVDATERSHWWNHPATKPLSLMRRLVAMVGPGTILDPFAGSGSTLRAAKDLGIKSVGIELDESYCEVIATRMSQGVLNFGGVA